MRPDAVHRSPGIYFTIEENFSKETVWWPVIHGAMGSVQSSFKLVWWCHQLMSEFLTKGYLPRVLPQSRRSLMIRVICGCAQISRHLLYSWGKPRKTSARMSVGSHSTPSDDSYYPAVLSSPYKLQKYITVVITFADLSQRLNVTFL